MQNRYESLRSRDVHSTSEKFENGVFTSKRINSPPGKSYDNPDIVY